MSSNKKAKCRPSVYARTQVPRQALINMVGGGGDENKEKETSLNARHAREGPMGNRKGEGGHNDAQTLAAPGQQQCPPDSRSFLGGEEETKNA